MRRQISELLHLSDEHAEHDDEHAGDDHAQAQDQTGLLADIAIALPCS
jgi:hypothetical protein